ncbi:MAG: tetratricopeptide repeat protein [Fimbriimonadaceae bacterium]|nr:tetratricopeptide repeat protein [Fimbriimonadaceae bacterium]QYK55584.1 MAG: tetratricopeptide repeat protein [Fimbriimonadaceae bacterium]
MLLPWRVEMLGGLRAKQNDHVVSRFQTQKTGALFARLCLSKDRSLPRDQVANLIWPTGEPAAIRNRLNQAVSSLRRQLEHPGMEGQRVFVSDHHHLGLNPQIFSTDVEEFENAVKSAALASSFNERVTNLEFAAEVYKGEFLAGFNESWVEGERRRLADVYVQVLRDLSDAYLEMGRPAMAADWANKLARINAKDAVAKRVLQAVRDGGSQPTEARFTNAPETSNGSVPALSPSPLSCLIPAKPNQIIGRDVEMARLSALMAEGGPRLVTIVGIGGIGKTRLALEAMHGLCELSCCACASASYQPGSGKGELVRSVLNAGLSNFDAANRTVERLQRESMDMGGLVIMLDVLGTLGPEEVDELVEFMEATPNVRFLVTNRRPLYLPQESVVPLGPLRVPDRSDGPFEDVKSNPSVALFTQRASAIKPDFGATRRTSEQLGELAQRLEGYPMALELAAAWIRSLTVQQMLESLDETDELLQSRRRDVRARHRSVHDVVSESLQLVEEADRKALAKVRVFRGGWTHEALDAVEPDGNALQSLQTLVDHGLIIEHTRDNRPSRFTAMQTVLNYASQDGDGASEDAAKRHAEYYLAFAERNTPLSKKLEQSTWIALCAEDWANMAEAADWFLAHDRYDEALRLTVGLADVWTEADGLSKVQAWLRSCLHGVPQDSKHYPWVQGSLGLAAWFDGDVAEAERLLEKAIAAARTNKDENVLARLLVWASYVTHSERDFDRGAEYLDEAQKLAQSNGQRQLERLIWRRRGNDLVETEQWEEAEAAYKRVIETAEEDNDDDGRTAALTNLGALAGWQEKTELSRNFLRQAIQVADDAGLSVKKQIALIVLGRVEAEYGNPEEAIRLIRAACERKPSKAEVLADAYEVFALAEEKLGNPEAASMIMGYLKAKAPRSRNRQHGIGGRQMAAARERLIERLGKTRFDQCVEFGSYLTANDLMRQNAFAAVGARDLVSVG